jgi:hypothetical protein
VRGPSGGGGGGAPGGAAPRAGGPAPGWEAGRAPPRVRVVVMVMGVEAYFSIVQPNIMAWSSWARLWQCAT